VKDNRLYCSKYPVYYYLLVSMSGHVRWLLSNNTLTQHCYQQWSRNTTQHLTHCGVALWS